MVYICYCYLYMFIHLFTKMSHYTGKTWINTYWLFVDQAVRMGVGFFTLLFVARALGPENFGILN
jgi:O-antigen/teichoic acid export membrane protein